MRVTPLLEEIGEKQIPAITASQSSLTNLEQSQEAKSSLIVAEKSENSVSEVPVISSSQPLTNLGKLFEEKEEENTAGDRCSRNGNSRTGGDN
ncbi:MAG UNVERIFIED_CONTAM: hypothetical protein LVR29_20890 [Microcystis novacekii LVE1205-3]|jgi:hypothetical protein